MKSGDAAAGAGTDIAETPSSAPLPKKEKMAALAEAAAKRRAEQEAAEEREAIESPAPKSKKRGKDSKKTRGKDDNKKQEKQETAKRGCVGKTARRLSKRLPRGGVAKKVGRSSRKARKRPRLRRLISLTLFANSSHSS